MQLSIGTKLLVRKCCKMLLQLWGQNIIIISVIDLILGVVFFFKMMCVAEEPSNDIMMLSY